jgi:hypothetical protein
LTMILKPTTWRKTMTHSTTVSTTPEMSHSDAISVGQYLLLFLTFCLGLALTATFHGCSI